MELTDALLFSSPIIFIDEVDLAVISEEPR